MSLMSLRKRSIPRELLALGMSLLVLAGSVYGPSLVMAQTIPGSPFTGGGGGGLSYPLLDNAFEVCDEADTTKCVQISAGGITTANDIPLTFSGTGAAPVLTFTGGTVRVGNGDANAPALAWAADADGSGTGLYRSAADHVAFTSGGSPVTGINAVGQRFVSTMQLGWTGGTVTAALDTILTREAAATVQLGADVNGAAVAQTLKAHDGITGTDIAGANFALAGGRGTGAGAGGNLIEQTAVTLATGTTAQTLADRRVIVAKPKALTAAAATPFVQIGVPQGTVAGGTIEYTIRANDGTNYQSRSGVLVFSAVNPSGTEVCTLGRPDGGATVDNTTDVVAVSSGTLTNTFTCVVGLTDVVQIAANAASSLTETVLQITYEVRRNEGSGAITPQ